MCLWQLWGLWKQSAHYTEPAFPWGLALVSPMVAATSAGQLATHHGEFYHYAGELCFFLTFFTAIPLFLYCYWSRTRPRGAAAGTAWIPLGVVGQSTAASTLLFDTHLYGLIMFTLAVPCVLHTMYCFYEAVLHWAPYGPGWWGSTFPVGTLCLGAWVLGCLGRRLARTFLGAPRALAPPLGCLRGALWLLGTKPIWCEMN